MLISPDAFRIICHTSGNLLLSFKPYLLTHSYHLLASTAFLASSNFWSSTGALEKIVKLKLAKKSSLRREGTIMKGPWVGCQWKYIAATSSFLNELSWCHSFCIIWSFLSSFSRVGGSNLIMNLSAPVVLFWVDPSSPVPFMPPLFKVPVGAIAALIGLEGGLFVGE